MVRTAGGRRPAQRGGGRARRGARRLRTSQRQNEAPRIVLGRPMPHASVTGGR